jgi:hypothetical protein
MICPACIANAALLVAGAASTGGLTALSAGVLRRSKKGGTRAAQKPKSKENRS